MLISVLSSLIVSSPGSAQNNADIENIFNWAENNFAQFFPNHQMTLTAEPWHYRFYPSTGIYIGARDEQIFVLGGPFGNNEPRFIITVPDLLAQIGRDSGVPACRNPVDGFTAIQNDHVVNITANGQCFSLINREICEPQYSTAPTNISVLSTTTLTSTKLSGIEFDNPTIAATIQGILSDAENRTLCTLNTPSNLTSLVVHTDICQSVRLSGLRAPDLLGITIPRIREATQSLTTTTTNAVVPDCFSTDAEAIYDLFTRESWIRQEDGSFTRNPSNSTPGRLIFQVNFEKLDADLDALSDQATNTPPPTPQDGLALTKNSGCLNCHNVDTRLVGPSLRDVAKQYAGRADAVAYLSDKIQNGSNGVWGPVPMPPNAMVNAENAKTLAEFILSLE